MTKRTFVDLFAGCGGLSLGMMQANWKGLFAVEKANDAFATFEENFLKGPNAFRFDWPSWLEQKPHAIADLLKGSQSRLRDLRKKAVDVVAGGPPCQGFSYAGRRNKSDPRNKLFEKYVQFVAAVQPKALVLENVPGMRVVHGAKGRKGRRVTGPKPKSYVEKLIKALDEIGYIAEERLLQASLFGVPQRRPRLVVIGLRKSIAASFVGGISEVFGFIEQCRIEQLNELGLPEEVTASDAISDLAVGREPLVRCDDPASPPGFWVPTYSKPTTGYQRLMHEGYAGPAMDSTRLANHTTVVKRRFRVILKKYRKGMHLSQKDREQLGLLKHRIVPMAPDQRAPTITTLPDDVLHYSEPRILSVRESARLQSFPDWFKFRGVYTTGGYRRKKACPRYTQVGNAVPPLLARAIGAGLARALDVADSDERHAQKTVSRYSKVEQAMAVDVLA